MGGQTHARRDGASGFSYVNDVVLAILSMLHTHERVMFVSTDAWHPSGVEEAFYTTDRVLCVSLHRYTEGFFPGSGGVDDRGHGAGTNHSINMPVLEGLDDDQIASLFVPVVAAAAERFQPSCVVYCAGAGVLAGDRLGCLNVTLEGYGRCLQAVLDIGRPLLVLGGCGFNQINTARAWCHATALICQTDVAEELPPHDFVEYYLPESTLKVATIEMTNKNSAESIQATLDASMKAAEQIPARAAAPTPPKAAAAEGDTATGATPAASIEADTKLASPGLTANEALLASPLGQPLPGNGADVPLDAASALEPAAKDSTDAPVPMETESEAAAASEGAPTPMATEEDGTAPASGL
jgi:histone deacetylase 1/2